MKTNDAKNGMKRVAVWTMLFALTAIGAGCGSAGEFQIQAGEEASVDNAIAHEEKPAEAAAAPQADAADEAVLPDNPETQEAVDNGAAEERSLDTNEIVVNPVAAKIAEEKFAAANPRKVVVQPAQMGPEEVGALLNPNVEKEIVQHYADKIPATVDRQLQRKFLCPFGEHRNSNGECSY